MAKRYYSKKSKCPEPINTLLDIAGAAAMGLYAKNKIKRDYKKGEGESSALSASIFFSHKAMRSGTNGMIGLGGLIGLNSALKDIEVTEKRAAQAECEAIVKAKIESQEHKKPTAKKNLWRDYCEDGSEYGISPENFATADDYEDALNKARRTIDALQEPEIVQTSDHTEERAIPEEADQRKPVWREHCMDGSKYGLYPENFCSADDYDEALKEAVSKEKNSI